MFVRKVAREYPGGRVEYVYLVESYRDGARSRQRTVANLGRADVLAPHLDAIVRLLRPQLLTPPTPAPQSGPVRVPEALTYGPVAVAQALWTEVGLGEILTHTCSTEVAERSFVLVAHRLVHPGSEHALAWWLDESFVPDARGQRLRPAWQTHGRVRVAGRQLLQWYRTLDALFTAKPQIETELYARLRDLFGLQVDIVFFDLTSTYFEGRGPKDVARHGHSRDGRPRNRQVLVGVVMASGWPIASYVFEGNRQDRSTVKEVLADVRSRFAVQRVVWVADRGMVSDDTLAAMTEGTDHYLVGLQRRRNPTAQAVVQASVSQPRQALPHGSGEVCEVTLSGDAARYVIVWSPERLRYERTLRRQDMRRTRDRLRKLARAVTTRKLRTPAKIGVRAGACLAAHHGMRYFAWALTPDGRFRYWIDRAKLRAERRVEGTYILHTNEPSLDALRAVAVYKDLQTVERGFRTLKDVLAVRPIYHRTAARVRAHLFVAHLALVLGCALEKALRRAGLTLALDTALAALRPVRLVTLEVDGTTTQVVTKPTAHAQAVLKAVGLSRLRPPGECSETA
jgi:transposase